uniref:PDZ domain-containing protein n=1 Tax=Anopheles maculatus TaxID=74869 RepID=A0A182SUT9_9DIPT
MSLYPSLEDMMVDKLVQSQNTAIATAVAQQQQQQYQPYPPSAPVTKDAYGGLYPSFTNQHTSGALDANRSTPPVGGAAGLMYPDLYEYMGLELSKEMIQANLPQYMPQANVASTAVVPQQSAVAIVSNANMVAPVSGHFTGLQRGQVTNGIREKSDNNNISVVVRDRPFERAITLHKDSSGSFGFQFNNGTITAIVKDSSAARNGLIIDQQLLEINGQNVIAMKDKEIGQLISASEQVMTLTIVPKMIYDVMMKKLSTSWLRGKMDHSVPDF